MTCTRLRRTRSKGCQVVLPNKALQQTGLSVAPLPLAPAAERRYVGRTADTSSPAQSCLFVNFGRVFNESLRIARDPAIPRGSSSRNPPSKMRSRGVLPKRLSPILDLACVANRSELVPRIHSIAHSSWTRSNGVLLELARFSHARAPAAASWRIILT